MEDECSVGNDETRIFILSSFASNKLNRVPCVVCSNPITIYDRYPLADGTFFLSPRQHNKTCVQVCETMFHQVSRPSVTILMIFQVKYEGKTHYLSSVCMLCLEGLNVNTCSSSGRQVTSPGSIHCRASGAD